MYSTFKKCGNDERRALNLLNSGKMELMRNQYMFRQGINADDVAQTGEDGNPNLPKKIEDVEQIELKNVINVADFKLFPKVLRTFEKDYGIKMRKINKN